MNITIWIIQSLLAAFFLSAALMKLTSSKEKLILQKQLQPGHSSTPVRILGIIELLGDIGFIIPLYFKIIP